MGGSKYDTGRGQVLLRRKSGKLRDLVTDIREKMRKKEAVEKVKEEEHGRLGKGVNEKKESKLFDTAQQPPADRYFQQETIHQLWEGSGRAHTETRERVRTSERERDGKDFFLSHSRRVTAKELHLLTKWEWEAASPSSHWCFTLWTNHNVPSKARNPKL